EQLAVIGGDEVGIDLARDQVAAVGVLLRDADPLDRRIPCRDLAAKQADAPGADDGEAEPLGLAVLHASPPLRCGRTGPREGGGVNDVRRAGRSRSFSPFQGERAGAFWRNMYFAEIQHPPTPHPLPATRFARRGRGARAERQTYAPPAS